MPSCIADWTNCFFSPPHPLFWLFQKTTLTTRFCAFLSLIDGWDNLGFCTSSFSFTINTYASLQLQTSYLNNRAGFCIEFLQANCMEDRSLTFSPYVDEVLLNARNSLTWWTYQDKCKCFYTVYKRIDPKVAPLLEVLSYLVSLQKSNLCYSSLNIDLASISANHGPLDGSTLFLSCWQVLLKRNVPAPFPLKVLCSWLEPFSNVNEVNGEIL